MAPVLWLFYNIKTERIDMLMANGILAIIGTAFTTWNWIHYANQYRKNRARVKKKNRMMIWMVPAMILALILGIAAIIGVMILIPKQMVPQNFLFMEQGPISGKILRISVVLHMCFFICLQILIEFCAGGAVDAVMLGK